MSIQAVTLRNELQGRICFALAAYEVERNDDHVAVFVPSGAPARSRDGLRDGPRGSFLRPASCDETFSATSWFGDDAVFVHRFGEPWSTWRWTTSAGGFRPGAYLNLEDPWWPSPIGWDTTDLTLDVVAEGDGSVRLKDEDELRWAEEQGVYTAAEVTRIRAVGERARAHVVRAGWPLSVDWMRWVPPPSGLPALHEGWDRDHPA